MRPEALGKGYQDYDVLARSGGQPSSGNSSTSAARDQIASNPEDTLSQNEAAELASVLEDEKGHIVARTGLRVWCCTALGLMLLIMLLGTGDWLPRIYHWFSHFPTLAR